MLPTLAEALALHDSVFPCAVFCALFLITLPPTRSSACEDAVLAHVPWFVPDALADAVAEAWAYEVDEPAGPEP